MPDTGYFLTKTMTQSRFNDDTVPKHLPNNSAPNGVAELRLSAGYLTIPEACGYLGCQKSFLYRRLLSGEVPFYQVGRKRFIKVDDLDTFIERQKREIYRRKGRPK